MSNRWFYGYNIVVACSVIQAINLGGVFTFGVLFPEFEREFGWSRTTISGATSFAFLIMGGAAIVMGRAADAFGPRAILSLAGILYALGYGLLFQLEAVWELYIYYGLLVGIGLAAHDVTTLSTVTRWFVRRRGLMTGLVKAGAGIGQVLVPMVAAILITHSGWRITCLLFGLAAAVVLIGSAQVLRRNPAALGLRPDGEAPDSRLDSSSPEDGTNLRAAMRTRPLWLLCLAKFCDLFCLFTIIVHIVPYAVDQGLAPTLAAGVLSTIGAMSIVGRLALGAAYDRIGARRALMLCFAVLGVSMIVLLYGGPAWTLFLFAAIYGPAHGGFFTITAPSVAEYFGTRAHGTLFGLVVSCGTLGATLGPLVAGGLFDGVGSYHLAFALLLAMSIMGLLVAVFLPRPNSFSAF